MELSSLLIPLGIIPAIAAMYIFTARYEGKYREKNILISFIMGMILGMLIYIMEVPNVAKVIEGNLYMGDAMIMAVMFSFLEQIAKFVVLNAKFLKDDGLPIYGAALGAGIASPFAPVFIRKIEISVYGFLIAIIPVMVIFIASYTAILIGIGIKKEEKGKYFGYAFIFSIPIWLILLFIFYFKENLAYFLSFFFLLFIVTTLATYHAYHTLLPFSMLKRQELKKIL